jgi:DNA-directed RNA polymerase specialized sigma24 family protein
MRSDAELLVAARSDASAFRELYERYADRVYGYHLRRSQDPHAAHDLTAETFAQAWLSRARFHDEARGSAGPWLFGIARHVLLVSVRRRQLERSACERLRVLDALGREPVPRPRTNGSTASTRRSRTSPRRSSRRFACASSRTSATTRPPSASRPRPRPCALASRAA